MRKATRLFLPLLSLLVPLLFAGGVASADVNDFTVNSFRSDETLSSTDPQGELHIVEHITVTFTAQNHGILRAIPAKYKGNSLHFHLNSVKSESGAPTNVSKSSQNGNVVLKIGDPSRTVTGTQGYTIDYTLENVITFYNDHDELYWDVNGDQWGQPFTSVSTTLHLPGDAQLASRPLRCFAGSEGSREQGNCQISYYSGNHTVTAAAGDLAPYQTLTYVVGFQKGYFAPMSWAEKIGEHAAPFVAFFAPPLIAFIVGFVWWLKRGRDAKGRGTIVPEYAPPEGLLPIEAGTIADFKVDNRDITATIIDFARRGYLKIIETREDRPIIRDKISYTLQLMNNDFSALSPFESTVLNGLFSNKTVGTAVDISTLSSSLYKTADTLRGAVDKGLTLRGYFKQNPHKFATAGSLSFAGVFIVFYIVMSLASSVSASVWPFIGGVVAGTVIFFAFVRALPARTALGVAAKEHLMGLKMYMETAEKDRLEKLEGPNAAYAANAGEPVRTVELFEKLLPYAIVLGVETQWAGKFNDIYTTPPTWYTGNWTAFNAGYLAGSLSGGFASAVNTSFSPPASSGSSGFGGGGFAGGGGGGGGGGGW